MTHNETFMPDQSELLEFFGSSPTAESPQDGFWCWEVEDTFGVRLRFSVNALEKSVQTEVSVARRTVAVVSHENTERLRLTAESGLPELVADFGGGAETTTLRLSLRDGVTCIWATLAS